MEFVALVGGGLLSYGVLTSMTPVPKVEEDEPAPAPWNPYVDAKGTYSNQPIVAYERDIDPQTKLPIVWQVYQNGTRRRVFLHSGTDIPQAPTLD